MIGVKFESQVNLLRHLFHNDCEWDLLGGILKFITFNVSAEYLFDAEQNILPDICLS